MKYRAEIDGLRALSVMAVVIFHFFPKSFQNGFLGVDIFFVISGFLISLQLISKRDTPIIETLKHFYQRRIKRLLPAVFVFLVFTTVIASVFFVTPDFNAFKDSLLPSITLWSNIFFWLDGGYFGGDSKLKILLHMWSLSVEEQFYLFYPLFLLLTFALVRKNLLGGLAAVSIMTCVSLGLCIYLYGIGGSNPAFFLLPTRIWQFGAGAIIAFYSYTQISRNQLQAQENTKADLWHEALALLSMALFALAFFGNLGQLKSTIIVTLAATLFIAYMTQKSVFARYFFTAAPVVFLGKISYSLYLYHWPIAVILLYFYVKNVPVSMSWFGVGLSIFLGYLSYKFIENPWRFKRTLPQCLALIAVCILSCCMIIFARSHFYQNNTYDKIAETQGTHFRCEISDYRLYGASRACRLGESFHSDPEIAVLGNSHAQMYAPLIQSIAAKTNRSVLLIPLNGCVPTPWINLNAACAKSAQINLDTLLGETHIKQVVIATTWNAEAFKYTDAGYDANTTSFAAALLNLMDILEKNGKQGVLIGPIHYPGYDISSELSRGLKFKRIQENEIDSYFSVSKTEYDNKYSQSDSILQTALGTKFLKPASDLCDDQFCYYGRGDHSYFADSSHLSQFKLSSLEKLSSDLEAILQPAGKN